MGKGDWQPIILLVLLSAAVLFLDTSFPDSPTGQQILPIEQPMDASNPSFLVVADTHVRCEKTTDDDCADNWVWKNNLGYKNTPLQWTKQAIHYLNQKYDSSVPLVLAGDLAMDEWSSLPEPSHDYNAVLEVTQLIFPRLALPAIGNHDWVGSSASKADFCSVILQKQCAWNERIDYTYDIHPDWRMLVVDSRFNRGGTIGSLSTNKPYDQITWLEQHAQLANMEGKDVIVVMHHDPVISNNEGITNPQDFIRVLNNNPNIKAVIKGHRHRWTLTIAPTKDKATNPRYIIDTPPTGLKDRPLDFLGYHEVYLGQKTLTVHVRSYPWDVDHGEKLWDVKTFTWS